MFGILWEDERISPWSTGTVDCTWSFTPVAVSSTKTGWGGLVGGLGGGGGGGQRWGGWRYRLDVKQLDLKSECLNCTIVQMVKDMISLPAWPCNCNCSRSFYGNRQIMTSLLSISPDRSWRHCWASHHVMYVSDLLRSPLILNRGKPSDSQWKSPIYIGILGMLSLLPVCNTFDVINWDYSLTEKRKEKKCCVFFFASSVPLSLKLWCNSFCFYLSKCQW